MTMTAHSPAGPAVPAPPGPLGSWVEAHAEPCRGGRTYRVLVNHRTGQLIELSEAEAGICRQLDAGRVPDASAAAGVRRGAARAGIPGQRPAPAAAARRAAQRRAAGRAVDRRRAAGDRRSTGGARHLFRPTAVAIQVLLALAGLAAVIAAVTAPSTSSCGSTRRRSPSSSA